MRKLTKSPGEKIVKDIKRDDHCPAVDTQFDGRGASIIHLIEPVNASDTIDRANKIRIALNGMCSKDNWHSGPNT